MAAPRPVFPGKVHFLTRRCTQRQFLLRPGKKTNQAIRYCLAEAAERFGMKVLWFIANSNHLHLGIYDEHGEYPRFIAHLHKMLAKCLNVRWGRWENLFASEQTSVVECADAQAIFDKMIYSLTNPVKDQLVEKAHHWPGVSSLSPQLTDREIVATRPHWFFADDGKMPQEVRLRFHRPPGFEHLSQDEWIEMITEAIAATEQAAADERRQSGRRILGRRRVLRQSPFDSPTSSEPRREMSPRVASRNKWRRIEALQRNKAWLIDYAQALEAYRAGAHDIAFPPGTWQLYEDCHVFRAAA